MNKGEGCYKQTQGKKKEKQLEKEDREFRNALKYVYGFNIHEIEDDGNCLFEALSHSMNCHEKFINQQEKIHHNDVRHQICNYLQNHLEQFRQTFDIREDGDIEDYISEMRKPETWGSGREISAFVLSYKCNVHVCTYDKEKKVYISHQMYEPDLSTGQDPNVDEIPNLYISYHKQNHYNSLSGIEFITNMPRTPTKAAARVSQLDMLENIEQKIQTLCSLPLESKNIKLLFEASTIFCQELTHHQQTKTTTQQTQHIAQKPEVAKVLHTTKRSRSYDEEQLQTKKKMRLSEQSQELQKLRSARPEPAGQTQQLQNLPRIRENTNTQTQSTTIETQNVHGSQEHQIANTDSQISQGITILKQLEMKIQSLLKENLHNVRFDTFFSAATTFLQYFNTQQ